MSLVVTIYPLDLRTPLKRDENGGTARHKRDERVRFEVVVHMNMYMYISLFTICTPNPKLCHTMYACTCRLYLYGLDSTTVTSKVYESAGGGNIGVCLRTKTHLSRARWRFALCTSLPQACEARQHLLYFDPEAICNVTYIVPSATHSFLLICCAARCPSSLRPTAGTCSLDLVP